MPPPTLTVRQVTTKADFKAFFESPWTVYKADPNWAPPLLSFRRKLLDKSKNPTWQHLTGDYFVAWRGSQPVGTISAVVNHRHNDYWDERIGFFGCFEVFDDQEAATALLDAASDYLRGLGCTAVRGPASFTTNDECGLLIENFSPPVILMPYNPPYYQRLIENTAGFAKVMDTYSYYFNPAMVRGDGGLPVRLERVVARIQQRHHLVVRTPDMKHLDRDLRILRELYANAWEKNWGFVPLSEAELDHLVKDLKQYFVPDLAFFAEIDGQPVGFILPIPDLNQALHPAHPQPGKPEVISLLQVLWHWKIRSRVDTIRYLLAGVHKDYRGIGVDAVLNYTAYQAVLRNPWVVHADAGWILETNQPMNQMAVNMGSHVYRTYRWYERSL